MIDYIIRNNTTTKHDLRSYLID